MMGLEGFEDGFFSIGSWKFVVSTTTWWIQQSRELCWLSAGVELFVWVSTKASKNMGKCFLSIEEAEVRCIHNMVVDTTKQTA